MNGTNSSSSFSCPSPLVPAVDGAAGLAGSPCSLPYKSVLWSQWDWAEGDRLVLGCTIASFISLSVIMLTWSLFPSKRRQHHLLMFMSCQFVIALVFVVALGSTHNAPSGIGLPSADSPVSESSHVCVFQSALFVFFTNAAVSWWTAIALTLFLKTVVHLRLNKEQQSRMTAAYHLSSWGLSLVLTVTAGASGWLGRSSVVPWCFFSDDAPAAADWALFYIPIGVRGVAGMAMMAAVMWRLSRQSALTASMRRRRSGWVRNMRPLLFCLQFLVIFIFLITFRAVLHFHQSAYTQATAEFVTCLLTSAASGECGARPEGGPSVALFFLIIIATAGQGVVPGLIYLSQRDTLQLWQALLTGQGLDGVSRTRGAGGESSVNTTSRVGGGVVSTNSRVGRKMSAKAPPPIPGSGDSVKAKAAAAAAAAARKGSFSLPSNAATTVRASPSPAHSGLVVSTADDSGTRAQAGSAQSNYTGLRISRADPPSALSLTAPVNDSSPPPASSPTREYVYDSPDDSGAFSIQMAGIRPTMYDSLPLPMPRTEWAPDARQAAVVQPPVVVAEGVNSTWSTGAELAAVNAAAYADDDCSGAMAGVGIDGAAAEDEQQEEEEDYRVSLPTDD